jgi:hypothetical protein
VERSRREEGLWWDHGNGLLSDGVIRHNDCVSQLLEV